MIGLKLKMFTFFFMGIVASSFANEASYSSEGQHARSITLNGLWEFTVVKENEQARNQNELAGLKWKEVNIPGQFMPWSQKAVSETAFVWVRRKFQLTSDQADSLAVLRWNYISLGAAAYINGRKVGQNEPIGPYQTIIPQGILQTGENEILLKVTGTRGARKSASGFLLFPAGFGSSGDMPSINDDVWIDFADKAYMKWLLVIPDIVNSKAIIRVTPTGLKPLDNLIIRAKVRPWPDGKVIATGNVRARLIPDENPLGGEHFLVDVPMPNYKSWTYEDRNLYIAEVNLLKGEDLLDSATFRFGMRRVNVKDRNYKLNGKNLWLRGSNLVFEWDWGDTITGHEIDYLVTEAREMSMNAFRTHTRPPPRLWADICDEYGTMILAEFPVLYNYQDYKFTPEELEVWHRNCLLDAAGWMSRLWNHPSVIMWVLSNESNRDNQWEEGPFQDFVNALDPTRPTMRTGTTGTRDNYDVHTCGNITDTIEGNLAGGIPHWFETAAERTTTNSEYMNYFGHPKTQWSGVNDERADQVAVAQIGAEHTEAMRRARVDAILPYMYAGWTRTRLAARVRESGEGSAVWKANYASPASACWHSSLSPVLASLDLFDASYQPGQQVTTELYLINDSWHDADIQVDIMLTKENPEFIPEAECFQKPISRRTYNFKLKADTVRKTPVAWQLPMQEGSYWLTARTTGIPGRPVLSQRFVRAIKSTSVTAAMLKKRFVILGGDHTSESWFSSHKLQTSRNFDKLEAKRDIVVIWNASRLNSAEKLRTVQIHDFISTGGKVVVLGATLWDWNELCDIKIGLTRGSRVFPYDNVKHPMLTLIQPQWLIRWNGSGGMVAVGNLEGPAMDRAEKILWVREHEVCVAAEIPIKNGKGRILFSQLDIQHRLNRSQPDYDPVTERILINMLN